jgi:hypothetical protein
VRLNTLELDLEAGPFPTGPFDAIFSICYCCRALFPQFHQSLATGGVLVVIQPTRKNLERHEKPPAAYLLNEGELRGLAANLEITHYEEGWSADGRHDAVLVARKPPAGVV